MFDVSGLSSSWTAAKGRGNGRSSSRRGARRASELLDRVGEVRRPPLYPQEARRPGFRGGRRPLPDGVRRAPRFRGGPDAGLHFDEEMLEALSLAGSGSPASPSRWGTAPFPDPNERGGGLRNPPGSVFPAAETAAAVNAAREAGGADRGGSGPPVSVRSKRARRRTEGGPPRKVTTRLFLYPGRLFRVVDAMITNFHLPRSSLLALVMAFAGIEEVRAAYREAVARGTASTATGTRCSSPEGAFSCSCRGRGPSELRFVDPPWSPRLRCLSLPRPPGSAPNRRRSSRPPAAPRETFSPPPETQATKTQATSDVRASVFVFKGGHSWFNAGRRGRVSPARRAPFPLN